jgi:hypothetical protein
MLDAGEKFSRAKFWTHVKPEARACNACVVKYAPRFEVDVNEQPYTTLPGQPFDLVPRLGPWWKTTSGSVLRYSDLDFASAERDMAGNSLAHSLQRHRALLRSRRATDRRQRR